MRKKKGRLFELHVDNRVLYTFVALAVLVFGALVVNVVVGVSVATSEIVNLADFIDGRLGAYATIAYVDSLVGSTPDPDPDPDPTAPSAPTGMTATTISSVQINLMWTVTSTDETVIELCVCPR